MVVPCNLEAQVHARIQNDLQHGGLAYVCRFIHCKSVPCTHGMSKYKLVLYA